MELRYTARSAGPVEEVYACHVFGMAQPLGFAIKAKNRVRGGDDTWLSPKLVVYSMHGHCVKIA